MRRCQVMHRGSRGGCLLRLPRLQHCKLARLADRLRAVPAWKRGVLGCLTSHECQPTGAAASGAPCPSVQARAGRWQGSF